MPEQAAQEVEVLVMREVRLEMLEQQAPQAKVMQAGKVQQVLNVAAAAAALVL
tara:strand:- start:221 stop:379 length:159 start_codon:yes stop_codon:yes gene_type:complete